MDKPELRIGQGWDIHRLVEGRELVLGGVKIPHEKGEAGHSDGDALIHALIDALLGALALGDIGTHFPDTDERWRGADSRELLKAVATLVANEGYEVVNADCTVILQRPKLMGHREEIRASLATCLGLGVERLSFKAKTNEGMGELGRGEAVEAMAVCLLQRLP
jgi:2-C-methyl-D-erythritol 2,4-cyclodiphosphate synthase